MAPFRLALALLPLLLTACWTGKPFYAADEVQAPIAPGLYQPDSHPPSERSQIRVSVRPDGYTSFVNPDGDTSIAGFVPLPGSEGLFVAWFIDPGKRGDGTLWYALLERRGSEYFLTLPMCSETRSLAESMGAEFLSDPKAPLCDFPDRASLESGLRRLAVEGPKQAIALVFAGKGSTSD